MQAVASVFHEFMLLEMGSEKFGFLPIGADIYVQALVSRYYLASPISSRDTQVQFKYVVTQPDTEIIEQLIVEPQRAIYQAAAIVAYINAQIIEATPECPFRR